MGIMIPFHGKFLEGCKWLNGNWLIDKAELCAQSFSRLGHVKTISKRLIEGGALVGEGGISLVWKREFGLA
jgi:hypothetical protein